MELGFSFCWAFSPFVLHQTVWRSFGEASLRQRESWMLIRLSKQHLSVLAWEGGELLSLVKSEDRPCLLTGELGLYDCHRCPLDTWRMQIFLVIRNVFCRQYHCQEIHAGWLSQTEQHVFRFSLNICPMDHVCKGMQAEPSKCIFECEYVLTLTFSFPTKSTCSELLKRKGRKIVWHSIFDILYRLLPN